MEMIDALVAAGMDTARLNFSHGTHEGHRQAASMVRAAAERAKRPITLLADLCGPKMRIGKFQSGSITLKVGAPFTLTTDSIVGDEHRVSVTYSLLPKDVSEGSTILIDDGLLKLRVTRVDGTQVHCVVEVGGVLSDNKGLNLPGAKISTPALTEKDKVDLAFAVSELHVDYLALSFVRSPTDVLKAQQLANGTRVIAKIENVEALEHLAIIADVADGIMVARGDLGVELGSEKVPLIQKRIIREVNERGKLVITATQMLDSMIRNPRPTRAEAADVANAVIDGTDAVMLSAETASGAYPIESVQMMNAIIREVETGWLQDKAGRIKEPTLVGEWGFTNAAARAAALLSYVLSLKAIVTFTRDGRTAELLSSYRPRAPIIAITPKSHVANRLAMQWGVVPRVQEAPADLEEALRMATDILTRENFAKSGDSFALVVGWPTTSSTNTVKLHRL
jgi:pyruvate kinase